MTHDLIDFSSLALGPCLIKALKEMKIEKPSPIQAQTIPFFLQGQDVIGKAETGSGKTAAFALPILENLDASLNVTQALILAPTRELAIQVASQCELLGKYLPGFSIAVLCGGQDYSRQLKQLREGAKIVVGTPGRILDHIERGTLKLNRLKTLILDEADEMLRMGFIEDVERILEQLPEKRQIALFSATMPSRIRQTASHYLKDPASVEIRSETATVKSLEQQFLFASQGQKNEALSRILEVENFQGVMVFVRTKTATEEVAQVLQVQGHRAMAIHGDLTQALRERIVHQFREGQIDVLVATDVAARGLDVERVTHVINYDMPQDCETYVHRIGRTARAGRSGVGILFVTPKESRLLNSIERHTRQPIEKIMIPTEHRIQEARKERFENLIHSRLEHKHLKDYRFLIEEFLKKYPDASTVDIAAALALSLHKDEPWQRPKEKMHVEQERKTRRSDSPAFKTDRKTLSVKNPAMLRTERKGFSVKNSGTESEQILFRLEVGRIHGAKPGNIVGAIANEGGLQSRFITALKIHEDHSTVKLPKTMPKEIIQTLHKVWVCGRQLKLMAIGG